MVLSPKETSEWETNTAFPEDRGVRGLYHHSEWPQVADAVIEADVGTLTRTSRALTPSLVYRGGRCCALWQDKKTGHAPGERPAP
jgi:hypothetical protein